MEDNFWWYNGRHLFGNDLCWNTSIRGEDNHWLKMTSLQRDFKTTLRHYTTTAHIVLVFSCFSIIPIPKWIFLKNLRVSGKLWQFLGYRMIKTLSIDNNLQWIDDLLWKMTFNWRWAAMEDTFGSCWQTTSNERQWLLEDDLLMERFQDNSLSYKIFYLFHVLL